jgi:hypothetical protein
MESVPVSQIIAHIDTDYTTQQNIFIVFSNATCFDKKTIIMRLTKHMRYTLTPCFYVVVFVDGTTFTNWNQFHGIHPIAFIYHSYR